MATRNPRSLGVLLLHAAAVAAVWPSPSLGAPYFQGKTVTIINGARAGSEVDLMSRLTARHLGRHIAGQPRIVVKNLPGARARAAQTYVLSRARQDGSTLYFGPWRWLGQALRRPGRKFDYDDVSLIGGTRSEGWVQVARRTAAAPLGFADDIKTQRRFRLGGTRTGTTGDILARLSFDLLGLPHLYVSGYKSRRHVIAAARGKEVNSFSATVRLYRGLVEPTMIKTGEAIGLWRWPLIDDTGKHAPNRLLKELPDFETVYRRVHGRAPAGPQWDAVKTVLDLSSVEYVVFGPARIGKEPAIDLRHGYATTLKSDKFVDQATRAYGRPPQIVPIGALRRKAARLNSVNRATRGILRKLLAAPDSQRRRK